MYPEYRRASREAPWVAPGSTWAGGDHVDLKIYPSLQCGTSSPLSCPVCCPGHVWGRSKGDRSEYIRSQSRPNDLSCRRLFINYSPSTWKHSKWANLLRFRRKFSSFLFFKDFYWLISNEQPNSVLGYSICKQGFVLKCCREHCLEHVQRGDARKKDLVKKALFAGPSFSK